MICHPIFSPVWSCISTSAISLSLLLSVPCGALAQTGVHERAIKDNDRIVFIGDSITGQGSKPSKDAWISLIREGLSLARPDANPTLVGLGGSGSTIGAWLGFEKKSRTEPLSLDVKENDVGKTLDAGAEVVVVMLGMNDVLAPSLRNDPENFDKWITKYSELVEAVRVRSHPRVIALATVTPCTEDPASPKNQVLAELNRRIKKLAEEKHFQLLSTSEASYEIQALGRAWQPYFKITGDLVHPNRAGHLAIAVGMLRGLGEEKVAAQLLAQHSEIYSPAPDKLPVLSYTLARAEGSPDDAVQRFVVKYQWTSAVSQTPPLVKASVPAGWTAQPESLTSATGEFAFTGPLDHAENILTLSAANNIEKTERSITIPAGWRIAVGQGKGAGWERNTTYDPTKDQQPLDEQLAKGEGLTAPVAFPTGEPGPWKLHVAGNDYTGGNRTGSVDFAAVTFFSYNQQACGARWVFSEKDRPVILTLSSQSFANTFSLGIWLNGQAIFAGKMKKETIPTSLRKGWNVLYFRSNFIQWQWQFSIDLIGPQGDPLSDLRYTTKPPSSGAQ